MTRADPEEASDDVYSVYVSAVVNPDAVVMCG
jgi:hypothetical protein